MSELFTKFKEYWSNYGFEILSIISLVFIFVLFIYNWYTNKRGTFTDSKLIKNFIQKENPRCEMPPQDSYYNYRKSSRTDSKLEIATKHYLEKLTGRCFFKIRPKFLMNQSTGRSSEIDLFNKELYLAVEVNGKQHYQFVPQFHLTPDHFNSQLKRDEDKAMKCRQMGIRMIIVPYTIKENQLETFLHKKLIGLNII